MGIQTGGVTFEVIVHFGTVMAVFTALRERVVGLVVGCVRLDREALQMVLLLALGSVSAAIVGLLFKETLKATFEAPMVASVCLLITGTVLWSTRFVPPSSSRQIRPIEAILIGVVQAVAILPGISRSGFTISTGLWRGIDGREAATFSFLLSIPAILGATLLEVREAAALPIGRDEVIVLTVWLVAAYVTGVVAIQWLLRILAGQKLDRFAYYCWAAGIVSALLQLA